MTSMRFFPPIDRNVNVPDEWGTGKPKESGENIWTPKAATFTYRDVPIEQFYDLTKLKRSNVRTNDQLLPDPKDARMDKHMIDLPFPAEHPYTSHIPRTAMFPKFAESPEDPKRGVNARHLVPKDTEMPAQPYHVTIVHKTKGFGDRHEVQHLVPESLKKPLTWPEPDFNQLVKSANGNKQQYYPTPVKYLVPNLEMRPPDQQISQRTSNALRNVERLHWKTTYNLNNTGHGPLNPLDLDNYEEKMEKLRATGEWDDELYPRSVNNFDPSRPVEGRIARLLTPRPEPHVITENHGDKYTWDPNYKRKKTLREKEEHRLLHGTVYNNLPDVADKENEQWLDMQRAAHPETQIENLKRRVSFQQENRGSFENSNFDCRSVVNPLEELRRKQHDQLQEMEAKNRWNLLELQKPSHDVAFLNEKYKQTTSNEKPGVFYKHEGDYQAERAGLYKTSYLPEKLTLKFDQIDGTGPGPMMFDTSSSHVDALNLPTSMSKTMNITNAFNQGNLYNEPNTAISGRLEPREVLAPLATVNHQQKNTLKPEVTSLDVRIIEKDLVNTETTHGSNYNTPKFLQQYTLNPLSRSEPLVLMSDVNQSLDNVKLNASSKRPKTVQFSENVTIATGAGDEPIRLSSAPMNRPVYAQHVSELQYCSRQAGFDPRNNVPDTRTAEEVTVYDGKWPMPSVQPTKNGLPDRQKQAVRGSYDSLFVKDQFSESRGKSIVPEGRNGFRTAYQSQFSGYNLGFKNNKRYNWQLDSGLPRPQTNLLNIQNSFSKTKAHNNFYRSFPENNPDLRDHIQQGRQHEFDGYNSMQLRGNGGGPIEVA